MTMDLAFALIEAIILDKTRDVGKAACRHIEHKVPNEELDTFSLIAYALLLTDQEKHEIVTAVLGSVRDDENKNG